MQLLSLARRGQLTQLLLLVMLLLWGQMLLLLVQERRRDRLLPGRGRLWGMVLLLLLLQVVDLLGLMPHVERGGCVRPAAAHGDRCGGGAVGHRGGGGVGDEVGMDSASSAVHNHLAAGGRRRGVGEHPEVLQVLLLLLKELLLLLAQLLLLLQLLQLLLLLLRDTHSDILVSAEADVTGVVADVPADAADDAVDVETSAGTDSNADAVLHLVVVEVVHLLSAVRQALVPAPAAGVAAGRLLQHAPNPHAKLVGLGEKKEEKSYCFCFLIFFSDEIWEKRDQKHIFQGRGGDLTLGRP